jgi:uncharacterized protein (TIGR04255 family)
METRDPLTATLPSEVPLPSAPLVRVISQLRFPLIVSIEKKEFIAPFQEAMRKQYPILRPEQSQGLIVGPQGFSAGQTQVVWRFSDLEGKWRVSLAPDFVAVETTAYISRKDFLDRLQFVLEALSEHVGPRVADRFGLRYIDRVTGEAVENIAKYVRPEIIGMLATPISKHVSHSITESVFSLPGGKSHLLVRAGRVPPGVVTDPNAIEPIDKPSWLLDLDVFFAEPRPFEVKQLADEARTFAERIYTFFRWAVTDEFLRLYGGKV